MLSEFKTSLAGMYTNARLDEGGRGVLTKFTYDIGEKSIVSLLRSLYVSLRIVEVEAMCSCVVVSDPKSLIVNTVKTAACLMLHVTFFVANALGHEFTRYVACVLI